MNGENKDIMICFVCNVENLLNGGQYMLKQSPCENLKCKKCNSPLYYISENNIGMMQKVADLIHNKLTE